MLGTEDCSYLAPCGKVATLTYPTVLPSLGAVALSLTTLQALSSPLHTPQWSKVDEEPNTQSQPKDSQRPETHRWWWLLLLLLLLLLLQGVPSSA